MKRSFIREILEHTTNDTISFAGGLPDERLFPHLDLRESAYHVLGDTKSLQYSTTQGYLPLRNKIAHLYTEEGFKTTAEEIMITSGAQQALDIISRYHHHKGITIEAPSYLGAMNLFDLNHLEQEAVALLSDGIDTEAFDKSFSQTKLAYLIPDFQNPTGYTYTQEKRKSIAESIKKHGGILIEDAPYSELYFKTKNQSISTHIPKQSFHLGSFSKVLAPSLRLGWIRADRHLLEPIIAYKEAMDLHSNGLSQYILDHYFTELHRYRSHTKLLRKMYGKKMQVFKNYLDELLPEFAYTIPQGGMFIYGKLPGIDTSLLLQVCLERGVLFVPGSEFYRETEGKNEIRFNFTNASSKEVYRGLKIIAEVYKEMIEALRDAA